VQNAAVPDSSNGRQEGIVTLVSPETNTAIDAILIGGSGWKRRGRRAPAFGDELETYVTMGDPDEQLTPAEEERAWAQVLQLDDQTALTLIYAAGRFLAENNDPTAIRPSTISVNEILEYRGYQRHPKGDFKTAQKVDERRRFSKLSRMYVVKRIGKLKRRPDFETSQLLIVTTRSGGPDGAASMPLPHIDEPDLGVPYEFDVQLGSWAHSYLHDPRRQVLLSKILRYDANIKYERFALRLGLALHFKPSRTVTVRDLLGMAHIEIARVHPEEFRECFEAAMDILQRDGIIGPWQYVEAKDLPIRKWLDLWLEWNVAISAAPAPLEAVAMKQLR
jgi:hypothetical protein